MAKYSVLLIEDEEPVRESLKEILQEWGYEVRAVGDGERALKMLEKWIPSAVICDLKLPRMSGMEVIAQIQERVPDLPVIVLTGHGSEDLAFQAGRSGVYDYITKPPDLNRLLIALRNATEKTHLLQENKRLRSRLARKTHNLPEIVGVSSAMEKIREQIHRVAQTDVPVLITGESGTGKELVAHWIHGLSARANQPFVAVNCGAIPSELVESELFGHEKGAFTSAVRRHIGRFEQAQGGTLFLDEIGEMSLEAQVRLLRALEEKKIYRVGGEQPIEIDVRIIAATNRDLKQAIEQGQFRQDLYYRLRIVEIRIPPLRERPDDIPVLLEHFARRYAEEMGKSPIQFSEEALRFLQSYEWRGNVRELKNFVLRAYVLATDSRLTLEDVRHLLA